MLVATTSSSQPIVARAISSTLRYQALTPKAANLIGRTFVTVAPQCNPQSRGLGSIPSTSRVTLQDRSYATVSTQPKDTSSTGKTAAHLSPLPTEASGKPSEVFQIHKTKDSYVMEHHIYSTEDLDEVKILHHSPKGLSDRVAWSFMKLMRWGFDVATRYPAKVKYPVMKDREGDIVTVSSQELAKRKGVSADQVEPVPKEMSLAELRKRGLAFGPDQWLIRCIFLESVAGVPGMVAATCRHLHSLRLLRRDRGWISTCLEDAENERMHLLTFLKIRQPGLFMRTMLLGAQGVFYNLLFFSYLISPRTVHRFVGNLEEEAVYTYTRLIEDLENGRLPEWENMEAPNIGKEYWKLQPGQDKMVDLLKVIRSDEAGHRFIHHTLADLDQKEDTNPFSVATPTPKTIGNKLYLTREESLAFIEKARNEALEGQKAVVKE